VPESIMELKRREFENLEQKDKTIMRYVKEFTLLSHYASDEVNTDEKRKKKFMRGLHPMEKMQLRMLKAADFQELVDAAITMEDDFKQVQEEQRKKAKLEPRKYPINKPTTDLSFKL
jgi:UDP-galactopyranose mutase